MKDSSGMSQWAAEAVKNINNENTPYQRRQAFQRKLAITGVTAGVTAAAGALKSGESEALQRRQRQLSKDQATQAAIRNAKRPPNHPDDSYHDDYGLQMAQPSYAEQMDRVVQGGQPQPLHSQPFSPPDTQQLAKDIQASNDASEAALAAPIGGHWTPKGFEDSDMAAAVNASDIQRAQGMMGAESLKDRTFGGLRNSFAGGN